MRTRARPMAPADRRAAILEAVLPVVSAKGFAATTHDLARAADVAEGTLFRVFDTKDELILEAAREVFRATRHLDLLREIDRLAPLEQRITEMIRIWQDGARQIVGIFLAFRAPADRERLGDPGQLARTEVFEEGMTLLQDLLQDDEHRFRLPVPALARLLETMAWSSIHPANPGGPTDPAELAHLLLHGVLQDEVDPTPA